MKLKSIALTCILILFSCQVFAGSIEDTPLFPKNEISGGFFDKDFYNPDIWHPPSPIFWGASHTVDSGFLLMYQRLLYHTQKYFSIYYGASGSRWVRLGQPLYILSAQISFRFWFFHTRCFSPYLLYSVAGPSIMSRRIINGTINLGSHFIWQDILGVGVMLGEQHRFNLEAELVHYSNGDFFTHNPGLGVPIVFNLGYSF